MKKAPAPMGELGLIEQIRRDSLIRASDAVTLGIGDDCAILRPPAEHEILVTTDFSLEGRHFLRDLHPPEAVGHRCLTRGLSDLAAMGATPVAAFLSLALPPDMLSTTVGRQWIDRFFKGLHALSEMHSVPLAGGDTSESPGGKHALILADIVLIGSAPAGKALRRSGASAGDALYVTGQLGGAAAELAAIRRRRKPIAKIPNADGHPHLFPEPRLDAGESLMRRGLASSCIDISDGLSTDLSHLCHASGVDAEIEQAELPIHPLAKKQRGQAGLESALHGGEDYELLFSAPSTALLPNSLAGVPVTRIGKLVKHRSGQPLLTLIAPDGSRSEVKPNGWEHFSSHAKHGKHQKKHH